MSDTKGEERHIKNIEETETEVTITFGKSEAEIDGEETAGWQKDKEKYREARPAQDIEVRAEEDGGVSVEGYPAVFNPFRYTSWQNPAKPARCIYRCHKSRRCCVPDQPCWFAACQNTLWNLAAVRGCAWFKSPCFP